jgi:hypothetical protein
LDEKRDDELVIGFPYFEHDSVPWNALPGQMSTLENGEWQVTDRPDRLPHTYTLRARKP